MNIFKSIRSQLFFIGFIVICLNGNLWSKAYWCTDQYSLLDKKGTYDYMNNLNLIIKNSSTEYKEQYVVNSGEIYSRTITDRVIKYTDLNGSNQYFIIKGKRIEPSIYRDLKDKLSNLGSTISYLTCNGTYDDINIHSQYKKTNFKLEIKYNTPYILANSAGSQYAFNHNMALVFLYFSKSITGAIEGLGADNEDKFIQAITEYFGGIIGGRGISLYYDIKNAKTTKELFDIIIKEMSLMSQTLIKSNPEFKSIIDSIYNDSIKLANNLPSSDGDITYESTINYSKKILDKAGKKAFNSIFKFTGLTLAKDGAESFVSFLTATSILIEMSREDMLAEKSYMYKFDDIELSNTLLSNSVYFLLSNYSISKPIKDRMYNFYPNKKITATEFSTMITNAFLYDDYISNFSGSKLDYINNRLFAWYSLGLSRDDYITVDLAEKLIKKAFELKIKKALEYNTNKEKIQNELLEEWRKYKIGVREIYKLEKNSDLTRGNAAVFIYGSYQVDWDKIIKNKINKYSFTGQLSDGLGKLPNQLNGGLKQLPSQLSIGLGKLLYNLNPNNGVK
jgi:hypothetical protein